MKIFVNEAINNGVLAYDAVQNQNYTLAQTHIFEYKVIELLVKIYGKINIFNPYQLNSRESLRNNLIVYGAKPDDIDRLFDLMNDYSNWLKGNSFNKNNIMRDIFNILALLVVLKNKSVVISSSEMKYYEDFFGLNDRRIKQLVLMSAINPNDVLGAWPEALEKSSKETVNVPQKTYLDQALYTKYKLSMEDVKKLSIEQLQKLNNDIIKIDAPKERKRAEIRKPIILTSGSGFVDIIVLLSIICTEIMIGVIIMVMIARF